MPGFGHKAEAQAAPLLDVRIGRQRQRRGLFEQQHPAAGGDVVTQELRLGGHGVVEGQRPHDQAGRAGQRRHVQRLYGTEGLT